MADLTFVQYDTAPSLFGTLTHSDGSVFDLTDATVRFQMRLAIDRRFSVDSAAVIVEAAAGRVRYDWVAGDLSESGNFVSRWQITFQDSSIEHTDPQNTIVLAAP
jgi:hypothetical protein